MTRDQIEIESSLLREKGLEKAERHRNTENYFSSFLAAEIDSDVFREILLRSCGFEIVTSRNLARVIQFNLSANQGPTS